MEYCYYCGKNATTKEHVPPKCIFPEIAASNGVDYRKNLIKVPSCKIHNTEKSNDDEYFLFILTSTVDANELAQKQFTSKTIRTLLRRPYIAKTFINNPKKIWLQEGKIITPSISYSVDNKRFFNIIEHIVRGLIYYEFGRSIKNHKVKTVYTTAALSSIDEKRRVVLNKLIINLNDIISKESYKGDNQKIFKYAVFSEDDSYIVKMVFYELFETLTVAKKMPNKCFNLINPLSWFVQEQQCTNHAKPSQ